jgi:hypothetical protein
MAGDGDRRKQLKSIERSVDKLETQFWDAVNDVDNEEHMVTVKNKIKQVRTNKTKFDKLVLPSDMSEEDRATFEQVKRKLKQLLDVIELNFGPKAKGKRASSLKVEKEKRASSPKVEKRGSAPKVVEQTLEQKPDKAQGVSNFRMFSEIMHRMGAVE